MVHFVRAACRSIDLSVSSAVLKYLFSPFFFFFFFFFFTLIQYFPRFFSPLFDSVFPLFSEWNISILEWNGMEYGILQKVAGILTRIFHSGIIATSGNIAYL